MASGSKSGAKSCAPEVGNDGVVAFRLGAHHFHERPEGGIAGCNHDSVEDRSLFHTWAMRGLAILLPDR
ncbi:MAG: hypothetical protein ACR2P2_08195 [Nakamurella sp.]